MNRRDSIKSMAIGIIAPNLLLKPSAHLASTDKQSPSKNTDQKLWYTYPAKYWNSQAMHIGNGFLGLSFLGGVQEEIFGITEKSLWTGGPGENTGYNYGIKPGGKDHLAKIRDLITSNQIDQLKLADKEVREHFLGDGSAYGHFSSFGRLSIVPKHGSAVYQNYRRSLDLSTAIAHVQYTIDDITFKREYFCSNPDRVAVLRFSADKAGNLSLNLKWNVFQHMHSISYENNVFELSGSINGNKRRFNLKMYVDAAGGNTYLNGNELAIENATTVTLTIAAATEYTPVAPLYNGADPEKITTGQITAAQSKTTAAVKQMHIKDYQQLYNRVKLNIPTDDSYAQIPTNERWKTYCAGKTPDPGFKVLYFNLSRYLLISSSRPGSLPANLQGGWNVFEAAQWSGNYQSNINVQLNYSSAGAVNLTECLEPYLNWINGLVKPGTAVAKAYYNTDGWVSHSIGNIWGYAAPGFEIEWGMYPAGAAWHCHYIWSHFLYSQDMDYLKQTAYPVMKGAALFWLQNLTDYQGRLISAPSGSAEHGAFIKDGKLYATGSSFDADIISIPCNFQDVEMIHDLFTNTIKAAQYLNIDTDFCNELKNAKERLMPLQIGQYGQLQEWKDDLDTPECNHRHIGHLYALWPGRQINTDTKGLAAAAKKTLELRAEQRNYTGTPHKDIYTAANWSLGLRMACWLRLKEAEHANKLFTQIITNAGFENLMTYQHVPQTEKAVMSQPDVEFFKTDDRYWYPVWQIDTSLAIGGFIAEMLLQTDADGTILLLPALPAEWPDGSVHGLKAEGGVTVDLVWKEMRLIKYNIFSKEIRRVHISICNVIQEVATIKH